MKFYCWVRKRVLLLEMSPDRIGPLSYELLKPLPNDSLNLVFEVIGDNNDGIIVDLNIAIGALISS